MQVSSANQSFRIKFILGSLFCVCFSFSTVLFASSRPVVKMHELVSHFSSEIHGVDDFQNQLRVKVFPHRFDYKPQGADVVSSKISITSSDNCQVFRSDTDQTQRDKRLLLTASDLKFDANKLRAPVWVDCSAGAKVIRYGVSSKQHFTYTGKLWISPRSINGRTELIVVNFVGIEEYLRGVVPIEVSASWPMESLKTQSVAARTYALYHWAYSKKYKNHAHYDVDDTIEYQAYTGMGGWHERTDIAIVETSGQVLKYNDEIVQAFFHADSGGSTDAAREIFRMNLPYITKVKELKAYRNHVENWRQKITVSQVQVALKKVGINLPSGRISSIQTIRAGKYRSGRVRTVQIKFSTGPSRMISGRKFKRALRLPSLMYQVSSDSTSVIVLGKGRGHGVGLSQRGARLLASEYDWNYLKILNFYYPKTNVCDVVRVDENVEFEAVSVEALKLPSCHSGNAI